MSINLKIKRRASLIKKILVEIVNNLINNEQIGYISLTYVNLSNDLSFCTVFYTILNDENANLSLVSELLEKNKEKIRKKLAENISNMKRIPVLIFEYDKSFLYGKNIDKILDTMK
ncbi:30S ribosome-binding factor RbfA [Candidatus Phytoplasma palmae]|uniref:30S ribosome-binding factor RbfA n=1 Tax=Candidatus Phytoplasma palmae TaxID=85624 RepID=UPI0039904319